MKGYVEKMLAMMDEIQSEWLAGNHSQLVLSTGYLAASSHYISMAIRDYWKKSRIKGLYVKIRLHEKEASLGNVIWDIGLDKVSFTNEHGSSTLLIDPYIATYFEESEPLLKKLKNKKGTVDWNIGNYFETPVMCAGHQGHNGYMSPWSIHGDTTYIGMMKCLDVFTAYNTKSRDYIFGSYRREILTTASDEDFNLFLHDHEPIHV